MNYKVFFKSPKCNIGFEYNRYFAKSYKTFKPALKLAEKYGNAVITDCNNIEILHTLERPDAGYVTLNFR